MSGRRRKKKNTTSPTIASEARRRARIWQLGAVVVTVVVATAIAFRLGLRAAAGQSAFPPPHETPRQPVITSADFVGADRCARCHAAEYDVWRRSTHARAGGDPSSERVIAPFDGRPIRFLDASVTPRRRAGGYEFLVERADEPARLFRVAAVVGGGHLVGGGTQEFVTAFDDGTRRILPLDWSRQGAFWFCNTSSRTGSGWRPITREMPLSACGDWPPVRVLGDLPRYANCQSCHASLLTVALSSSTHRYDTRFTSLNINCEACHGPGRKHAELADRGEFTRSADIGMVSLAALDQDAADRVCYQCHAVKDQLRDGFISGEPLTDYYSLAFPLLGDRPLHPDGRVRTFAYQEGQQFSDCRLNGGMTCTSCHDPHSQQYRDVDGAPLQGRFDDRQCTACHVSKADRAAEHSHHAPASAGSRCTSCHMPYRQEPETQAASKALVRYARSDHTIAIPRPALDSVTGVVTACANCHATTSTAELERQVRRWWGELKPVKPIIAAQQRFSSQLALLEATPLLLGEVGDAAGDRHAVARFAGLSRLLDTYLRPGEASVDTRITRRLEELARHPDIDVRAIALAALHLSNGSDRSERRFLAHALSSAGAHDGALRARWSLALGYMGDTPSSARLLLNLANAQRDGGDIASALATYRRSIASDSLIPLAWVNFGIAMAAGGDTASAVDAFTRASSLDPADPLPWFNLGNIAFARGDLSRAASLYEKTLSLDESIVPAHFQLARARLLTKDYIGALRSLRRGLAFDSSDASARAMAVTLAHQAGLRDYRARP